MQYLSLNICAAATIFFNFFWIIGYGFNGRLANVAKPQSGFNQIFSGGRNCKTSSTLSTISSTDSIRSLRGLIQPNPRIILVSKKLLKNSFSISPARGVENSSANISTSSESKNLLNLSYAPCEFLSMGMSNDYKIAIEEGATHIRVGTALVGCELK